MKRFKLLVSLGGILAALSASALVFLLRAPVLVVTDPPFVALYGEGRIRARQASASAALFRRVLPVMISGDASPDMLLAAISYASESPFAVLFPLRFASAAERFREEFPGTPVALLRGAVPPGDLPEGGGFFSVIGTDRAADLFRAGLFAGAAGAARAAGGEGGRRVHVLWQDRFAGPDDRELFYAAVSAADPGSAVVFVRTHAEMPDPREVSSLVMMGIGADFFGGLPGVPVVLFGWLDPALTSRDVVAMFDDSPWALAAPAARMAARGAPSGEIPSKALVFSDRIADNRVARALRRAAGRRP